MDKVNSFIENESQQKINAPLNGTLIAGTHRMCDLIPVMLEAIRDTPEYTQLSGTLPSVVTDPSSTEWDKEWNSEEVGYLYEELTEVLERYAPEGYYFGTHPGDGSDFGYWRDEAYMLGEITGFAQKNSPIVLNEDIELIGEGYAGVPKHINAHQVYCRENDILVGDKFHMVNINTLDEDSVEKLFNAVYASKALNLQILANIKIGDNIKYDFYEHPNVMRIDLGNMPDTITVDTIKIENGKLSFYSEDLRSDIDINKLTDIEYGFAVEKFSEIQNDIYNQKQNIEKVLKERIITPSMRSFSEDGKQKILNFTDMYIDKSDATKQLENIADRVKEAPEVANVPSNWITDAVNEMKDLANGIEREEISLGFGR
jgi:hypothetical protein